MKLIEMPKSKRGNLLSALCAWGRWTRARQASRRAPPSWLRPHAGEADSPSESKLSPSTEPLLLCPTRARSLLQLEAVQERPCRGRGSSSALRRCRRGAGDDACCCCWGTIWDGGGVGLEGPGESSDTEVKSRLEKEKSPSGPSSSRRRLGSRMNVSECACLWCPRGGGEPLSCTNDGSGDGNHGSLDVGQRLVVMLVRLTSWSDSN